MEERILVMGGLAAGLQEAGPEESAACRTANFSLPPRAGLPWSAVRGVVFDMGDILYDATLWRRWLVQLLHRLGYNVTYRGLFEVWDRDYLGEVHRGGRDYQEAFDAFLVGQGLPRGLIDEIVAASQTRKREIAATLRTLPGVRSTLVALQARGLPLAVLSDSESPSPELRKRLAALGIDECFQAVVSSFDLRATKPAGVTYQSAAEALGRPLSETAFVGHDADELDGAMAVGMPTIAFNGTGEVRAHVHLQRFEQLLTLLRGERALAHAG
jgi:HAD superfamily hydrolase (TIGR01509 family)